MTHNILKLGTELSLILKKEKKKKILKQNSNALNFIENHVVLLDWIIVILYSVCTFSLSYLEVEIIHFYHSGKIQQSLCSSESEITCKCDRDSHRFVMPFGKVYTFL